MTEAEQRVEEIRRLHSEGKTNREIVREVWGPGKAKGGRSYTKALRVLHRLLNEEE